MDTLPEMRRENKSKIKETTVMKDFPLYCHWCKQEFIVDVENFIIALAE